MRPDAPPRPTGRTSKRVDAVRAGQDLLARSAKLERLGPALRHLAEELALERRRNASLRSELERVRRQLAITGQRSRS